MRPPAGAAEMGKKRARPAPIAPIHHVWRRSLNVGGIETRAWMRSPAQGMLSAVNRFDKASANLESAALGQGDIASAAVDQVDAKTAFVASTGVLKTSQDMFKALLDITV
jgi:hypothetical protein